MTPSLTPFTSLLFVLLLYSLLVALSYWVIGGMPQKFDVLKNRMGSMNSCSMVLHVLPRLEVPMLLIVI